MRTTSTQSSCCRPRSVEFALGCINAVFMGAPNYKEMIDQVAGHLKKCPINPQRCRLVSDLNKAAPILSGHFGTFEEKPRAAVGVNKEYSVGSKMCECRNRAFCSIGSRRFRPRTFDLSEAASSTGWYGFAS